MDYDTMFLTPDCGKILHDWAEFYSKYPEYNYDKTLLTCYTNRIHPLAKDQLLNGYLSEVTDISHHINLAEKQRDQVTCTRIEHEISGFLMMFSKKLWNEIKFSENGKCLGVDNDFSIRVLEKGYSIARMDNLYVWHTYRLKNGIHNKEHLK
jgi:GT2 family glycosyltransferase